jgi:hypothetical protein
VSETETVFVGAAVLFVHAIAVMVIGKLLNCPMITFAVPAVLSTRLLHTYPVWAMQELPRPAVELKTPR